MKSNRWVRLSAAAAIAASVAGVAFAQGGPGRMMEERGGGMMGWGMGGSDRPGWGMGMGGMWGRGLGSRGPDWMLDRIEGRLAFLKTELKITEAQTAPGTSWPMSSAPPPSTTTSA